MDEKVLGLGDMENSSHFEICKRLVDEMTIDERKLLIRYIKKTMLPPAQPPKVNNLVSFK